jgi:hypothetical protein
MRPQGESARDVISIPGIPRSTGDLRAWHLFILALVPRLAMLWIRDIPPGYSENLRAGFTLATQGYLGNPFSLPTGPTAHVAPFFPLVVAAAHEITGDEQRAVLLIRFLLAIAASLNVALLVPLSRRLQLPRATPLVCALFWIVPLLTWVELSGEHETVLTTLSVLVLLLVLVPIWMNDAWTVRSGLTAGVLTGVGAHVSPLVLPMVAVMASAGFLLSRPGWSRALRHAAAATIGAIFVLTPYTARNLRVMHGFFLVRDNFGLELSVSNNDHAVPAASLNLVRGRGFTGHPTADTATALLIRNVGEVNYNREQAGRAVQWIRDNPSAFLRLTAGRLSYMAMPFSPRLYQRVFGGTIFGLFVVGVLLLYHRQRRAVMLVVAALLGYGAVLALIQHDIRYVYPMIFVESLVAGAGVVVLASRLYPALSAVRPT